MLATRILSGLVLAGTFIALILLLPPLGCALVFALAVLIGAWEWSAFLRVASAPLRVAYVLLIAALLVAGWYLSADAHGLRALLGIAALWWLVALAWLAFAPQRVSTGAAALAGVLTLVPAWVALARMRADWDAGARWTLYVLVLVSVADTGAYFAGRFLGRHKLAPRVSPGKTWEGAVGGVVAVGLLAYFIAPWLGVPRWALVLVSAPVAGLSIVGDLTESMFKRHAGLKDSGSIIPGHGGVLDRMDSVTAAAPLLALALPLVLARFAPP